MRRMARCILEPTQKTITITISTQVDAYLAQLVATGLYGKNKAEAAELLICRGLVDRLGLLPSRIQQGKGKK